MTAPMRDPALGVEVGIEVQRALMTVEDWSEVVDRFLDSPPPGVCRCGHTSDEHQDVDEQSPCPCGCAVASAIGGSNG